jgi:osmotically-inducible protein OsmY
MQNLQSELATNLSAALERDERTDDSQIEVIDNNGVVTLSGTALSQEARDAAGEIAQSFAGVLSVINDIAVARPDDTGERVVIAPVLPPTRQP